MVEWPQWFKRVIFFCRQKCSWTVSWEWSDEECPPNVKWIIRTLCLTLWVFCVQNFKPRRHFCVWKKCFFSLLEQQLKCTSEKDPKRVCQQTIERYHPCSRRDIVSRASINTVYIQRRVRGKLVNCSPLCQVK